MSDSSRYSPEGSVCDEPAESPLDKRPAPADANLETNSMTEVRETSAIKSVGGGLKPVADDHEQQYNRTNSATFQSTSRSARALMIARSCANGEVMARSSAASSCSSSKEQ